MARKQNRPDNIYPYKDCVLIVEQKYAKQKMEGNDLMNTLLIYEGNKIIKQEPVRERVLKAGIIKVISPMKSVS